MPADLVHEFIALWESSDSPPDVLAFLQRHAGAGAPEKLKVLLADQPRRWRTACPLRVEDYLAHLPELASDPEIKLQLVVGEFQTRHGSDTAPSVEEFASRFPDLGDSLSGKLLDVLDPYRTSTVTVQAQRIGRYRSLRLLGEGAFGRVWLAFDDELQRQVAIKVPKAERFQRPEDAEAYLAEARTVAGLDHPHIVPVYDVGRTADGSIYVVSRFIEGRNLAERIGENRPSPEDAAALLAKVAAALHHAHQKHLIHRDIKPANILIEDRTGAPFVADFGLAITEENSLGDTRLAGTPAYMSPEQARGEGHRLDGRSDIFALGVVFYEMLTGKRPFRGSTHNELLHQVITTDPSPPRELADAIPAELERICLKALSKRASDRYATAAEMAEDLAHWRQGAELPQTDLQIVPKGLRSFDAGDADFFLQLLPGPRNRTGLPESLQFWKSRLEETDPEQTFSVGLIYGPSGCGKSSLMKAGLLPRLSKEVLAVYVEATPDDTETRILRGVRKLVPELAENLGLAESFAFLRRRTGKKVVVVLDQFEQWLHAHRTEQETELVAALRQCDGGQLQAVVMVRDDFWLAASRFMSDVEVELLQGNNIALVDLFDVDHAQKVLCKFGQAYGKLPAQWDKASPEEQRFVEAVAGGLAQDGKVVSVRIALFAEMVKGKPWTPATLAEVGGTEGIGVNFLEETFASRTANPKHRLHQEAARAVLKALLPEVGADIKGHMRSHGELLAAAGYQARPQEFHELLRMLDGELRLITPTDPEGAQSATGSDPNSKFYQLTHDYLVPSLRDWLTRKQKETAKGRAELLLADRAAVWNSRQENQQLPSLLEWGRILWLTDRKSWSLAQTKMLRQARRYHLLRGAAVCAAAVVLLIAGLWVRGATYATGLVQAVLNADTGQVLAIVKEMAGYRIWTDPLLRKENEQAAKESRARLHTSLALLPVDAGQVDYLTGRLLAAEPQEVAVLCEALEPHQDRLSAKLWGAVKSPPKENLAQRLRAAAALALFEPGNPQWKEQSAAVVRDLVLENPVYLGHWSEAFRPVKSALIVPLGKIYRDPLPERASERTLATNLLADYASDNPQFLADLLLDGDAKQFVSLFPKFAALREQSLKLLQAEIAIVLPAELPSSDPQREALAKRQANAGAALMRLGQTELVWPLLEHSPDPRVRSYLIHWFSPLGVDPNKLIQRLNLESNATVRSALLLSLGEFSDEHLPSNTRQTLLPKLHSLYCNDEDSGVHGASEWLLRHWGEELPALTKSEQFVRDDDQDARYVEHCIRLDSIRKQWVENQMEYERRLQHSSNKLPDTLSEGLIAHYPFDESEGSKAENLVVGKPPGEFNMPEQLAWRKGVLGNAAFLKGDGGHFNSGNAFEPERTDPFSCGCWYFAAPDSRRGALFARFDNKALKGFAVHVDPASSDILAEWSHHYPDNILIVRSRAMNITGNWRHLFVTYNGSSSPSGVTIYLDGKVAQHRVELENLTAEIKLPSPLQIGMRDSAYAFRGAIDDLRIYNKELTPAEVAQLYIFAVRSLAQTKTVDRTTQQQQILARAFFSDAEFRSKSLGLRSAETDLRREYLQCVKRWFVNSQGQTFVVLPGPVQFSMGTPESEDSRTSWEQQHQKLIPRSLAVATKHVTIEDFNRFNRNYFLGEKKYHEYSDQPAVMINWHDSAGYCNWLSMKAGIPEHEWCYEPRAGDANRFDAKPGFLNLIGYRMMTESEAEYVARSGTTTSRHFGESRYLLNSYSWWLENNNDRTARVGLLKPNDFGIFDSIGNISTWCSGGFYSTQQFADEITLENTDVMMCVRGASFNDQWGLHRSGRRTGMQSISTAYQTGLRVVRTIRLPRAVPKEFLN